MTQMKQKGLSAVNVILIIILIVILAFFAFVFYREKNQDVSSPEDRDKFAEEETTAERTDLESTRTPRNFPSDIPIEPGAALKENFEAEISDGRFQATRSFISGAGLQENFDLYLDFLNQSGRWTVANQFEQDDLKTIFAADSEGELVINISRNLVSGEIEVDLSYTTLE